MSGFGIVGTGVIAALHAAAIRTLPGARLAAVTDIVAGAAGAFAAARGCAAEPDLDALLARPDVDVVCVCVPSGLHAEIGIRAARAGKHLAVEKPVDVTLAAADRLIEAARTAGVALTVISQHRFDPALIELKRLIGEGAWAGWCSARPAPSGTGPRSTTTAPAGAAPGRWTAAR